MTEHMEILLNGKKTTALNLIGHDPRFLFSEGFDDQISADVYVNKKYPWLWFRSYVEKYSELGSDYLLELRYDGPLFVAKIVGDRQCHIRNITYEKREYGFDSLLNAPDLIDLWDNLEDNFVSEVSIWDGKYFGDYFDAGRYRSLENFVTGGSDKLLSSWKGAVL